MKRAGGASGRSRLFQHPFAAGDGAGPTWVDFRGHAQRPREGLETGFDDVVGIHPVQLTDVQGEAAVVHHRHEKFLHQLGVVRADLLAGDGQAVAQMGRPEQSSATCTRASSSGATKWPKR